jgi:hypothetical protein
LEPQVSLAVAFQNFKTPDYGPAIRRSLATRITKYIEGLRDTFLLSPTTPQITKDDVISAMRDCYKEKPRTQAVTWQVLRQAIGPRFFQRYKGTVSGTVASEIIYDDISDFLPKEFWDARLASSNTEGESQKIASEELVETNTKLLFARAALERYSGSNSLVKVLACLFGGHRDYLAKPKYKALHGKVREKSALAEVWFIDKEDLKKRESRKAKVGINYDKRGRDDPNSDVGIVETSSDTDSEINFVGTVKRQRNYSRNYWYWHKTKVTEFDPAEAVELLKSAHSSQLGQRVLPQLKSFARLVQDLQEETSDEAAAVVFLCPAIVISARLGAFVATDDNVDHATVEDILSLLPSQCLTVAAFHKTVSSAISLAAIDAVAIVPTSLVKRCIFNPTLSDLDKLADYFRPVISDTQPQRSKTVLIHPPNNAQCLAICEVTIRKWPHPENPNKIRTTSKCEVVTICVGPTRDTDCVDFGADLERLFKNIFLKELVEWAWWTVEDEDNPNNLHAAEWVIRTSLKIDSAQSSNATLILIHAVFAILGPVKTGTISKLIGYESFDFRGDRPLPLVERPINYERTRLLASLLVSRELKRDENYAQIHTYQRALLETEGEENIETPQFSVTKEDDI